MISNKSGKIILGFWVLVWGFFVWLVVFKFLFCASIAFTQPVNICLDDLNELLSLLIYSAEGGFSGAFNGHSDANRGSQIPMEEFICIFHCIQIKLSEASSTLSRLVSFSENVTTFRLFLEGLEDLKL